MKKVAAIVVSIMIVLTGVIFVAHAQTATIDLSLTTIPLNPSPLQQVTITAQSYSTDITQADLVWTYNNKVIASGVGRTQITITAPASGATGTISLTASGSTFSATSTTLTLRPASVDLLYEGVNSYTPPFYKGLPLPVSDSIIRVTAVPTINAPQHLTYNWSENGEVVQARSGYDKNSFTFQNDYLSSQDHIEVTEQNGGFSGTNDVDINPGDPTMVGYFNDNGYIDYANGSTESLSTSDTGAIVHFDPYFFSVASSVPHDLTFSYSDNDGNPVAAEDQENELRLSRPDNGGRSQFTIAITTVLYSLENISRKFSVNFN